MTALRAAEDQGKPVPLVLTDVCMPEVDGLTLAEWIRQDPDLTNTAIIVLTSGARSTDLKRCEELNVAAHLMKPIKQSELLQAFYWILFCLLHGISAHCILIPVVLY